MSYLSLSDRKRLGLDAEPTQARNQPAELDLRSHTFEHAHVCPADLLQGTSVRVSTRQGNRVADGRKALTNLDELEFCELWQPAEGKNIRRRKRALESASWMERGGAQSKDALVKDLDHPKHRRHNVDRRVAVLPQRIQLLQRSIHIALGAATEHLLDDDRVRLVAHLEDVFGRDDAEARVGRLEVVERLAHVALGRKDER